VEHALGLVMISAAGIALAVWLIAKVGLHPFVGLLSAAMVIGLAAGVAPPDVATAIEKGFSDILKGTGLVVALGLGLGAMLQISGGAQALAMKVLSWTGQRYASLGALLAALLVGLPLFFETGVVLLMPIIVAGVAVMEDRQGLRLRVILSALAGLSVLHALLPPHPGPLIALRDLQAPLLRTMMLGAMAAVPTALIAGPLLARYTTRGVVAQEAVLSLPATTRSVSVWAAAAVLLFPIVLISLGSALPLIGGMDPRAEAWMRLLAEPPVALLLANLFGLVVLFGRDVMQQDLQDEIWSSTVIPAGGMILSIGAGGSLKQVLVSAGLPGVVTQFASVSALSPIIIAWLVAVAIRVGTGSATVATITASGIMSGMAAAGAGVGGSVDPSLLVLAIGAGSVFFSHVNDPGFWLVKSYMGTSTSDTFRTWSMLETAISVVGLAMVLLLNVMIGR
jgi:GntP family gluconate:H+ symporter